MPALKVLNLVEGERFMLVRTKQKYKLVAKKPTANSGTNYYCQCEETGAQVRLHHAARVERI